MPLIKKRTFYKPMEYPWAFEGFKLQHQMHWLPEEVHLDQDVHDWKHKLTDKERNLITQIFRFFTQGDCFIEGTEILTDRGWVSFKDLLATDLVGQVEDDCTLTFVSPTRYICKDFSGDMIALQADRVAINSVVTPNHKVVYRYKGEWGQDIASKVKLYQRNTLQTAPTAKSGTTRMTPVERLKVAIQADGSLKKDVDGSKLGFIPHRLTFTKERKITRLREILEAGDFKYREYLEKNGQTTFYVQLQERLSKTFDWIDLSAITEEWASSFVEEILEWDGHVDECGNGYYYNTIQQAVDVAQAVALLSGRHSVVRRREDSRSDKFSDIFRLSIGRRDCVDTQHLEKQSVPYTGKVYCVTVPSGRILTRYKGVPVVSGNCDVADGYYGVYIPMFKPQEVRMMMGAFAAVEGIHVHAYSLLLDTIGMPESEYKAFTEYEAMLAKHDYVMDFNSKNLSETARSLAVYSGFMEGMQLFASFAMLLNFPRQGKLNGMGQIVTWSIKDEAVHVEYMIKLFRQFIAEHPRIWTKKLQEEIYQICREMVSLEDAFIDLAFELGGIEGLDKEDVKTYIRYIADRRLIQLGLKGLFNQRDNPLPWIELMLSLPEHTNFFENRSTEYAKGALTGNWSDVWAK